MCKLYNHIIVFIIVGVLIPGLNIDASTNIDSIKKVIETTKDKKTLLRLYNELSKTSINENDSRTIEIVKNQVNYALNNGSDFDIAEAYNSWGLALKLSGDISGAVDKYFKEKDLREKISDKTGLANVYKNLGESFRSIFDYNTSLDFLKKALDLFIEIDNIKGKAETLNRFGAVYNELSSLDMKKKAIDYANESNILAKKINNIDLQVSNLLTIGASYSFLGENEKGLKYFFEALNLINSANEKFHIALILKDIGTIYFTLKDYNKAIKYGMQAYSLSLKYNIRVYQWLSADLLSAVYEKLNIADSTLKYFQLTSEIKYNLYSEDKENAVHRVEAKFQNEKYEKNLESQIKQKRMFYVIYSVFSIFLIVIFFLVYSRYKALRKTHNILFNQNKIIESQKLELTELNATKDKFFSIIAHDLRGPIGTFKNILEQLLLNFNDFHENEKIESLTLLNNDSKKIMELLDDLLTWARTKSGKISFNPQEINLKFIIENIINLNMQTASKKNISLISVSNDNSNCFADVNMVSTILRNLIINAIKFTKEYGRIIIPTHISDDFIEISVKDDGVGMTDEQIDKLFKVDKTLSTPGTNNEKGTGLGLILCKEFTVINGGTISVESKIGIGSTFSFTLPLMKIDRN